jgi:hypothetical protein
MCTIEIHLPTTFSLCLYLVPRDSETSVFYAFFVFQNVVGAGGRGVTTTISVSRYQKRLTDG